jgi:hypothetical protein
VFVFTAADCYKVAYATQFGSIYFDNYLRETVKRKKITLAHFHRFPAVVSCLHCFWACGEAEHCGKRVLRGRAAHLTEARKQRDRKGARTRYLFPGHTSSDLLPPARLHLLISTTSQEDYKSMNQSMDCPTDKVRDFRIQSPLNGATSWGLSLQPMNLLEGHTSYTNHNIAQN